MSERPSSRTILALGVLGGGLLSLAISSQSLWIDEGVAVRLAAQGSVKGLFLTLHRLNTSDPQMPLYLVYMWVWTRVFGAGEAALRASNVPFALLLSLAFSWAAERLLGLRRLLLLAVLSPFLWVYMNEARPYVPVVALSTVCVIATTAYLVAHTRYGAKSPWFAAASLLFLCAWYMLGVVLVVAMVVMVALEVRRNRIPWGTVVNDWKLPALTHMPLFLLLGVYYALTLLRGSGGARGIPGVGNVTFALYEFLGFSGLGPPRTILRAHPHLLTFLPYWPWLCIGGLAALGLILVAAEALGSGWRRSALTSVLVSLGAAGALMTAASGVAAFQFWGRHWAPLFPLFLLGVAQVLSVETARRRLAVLRRATFVVLLLAWAASDIRLRWMPVYHKDDYRLAAAIALSAHRTLGATIAWVADGSTAQYYGLQADNVPMPDRWPVLGRCLFAANWTGPQVWELIEGNTGPTVLVLSKPDLYDRSGAWGSAVREFHPARIAAPNAFVIYLFDKRLPTKLSSWVVTPPAPSTRFDRAPPRHRTLHTQVRSWRAAPQSRTPALPGTLPTAPRATFRSFARPGAPPPPQVLSKILHLIVPFTISMIYGSCRGHFVHRIQPTI